MSVWWSFGGCALKLCCTSSSLPCQISGNGNGNGNGELEAETVLGCFKVQTQSSDQVLGKQTKSKTNLVNAHPIPTMEESAVKGQLCQRETTEFGVYRLLLPIHQQRRSQTRPETQWKKDKQALVVNP